MISNQVICLSMSPRPGSEKYVDAWFDAEWGRQMLGVVGFEWESKHLLAPSDGAPGGARYLVLYGITPGRAAEAVRALNELLSDPAVLHPDLNPAATSVGQYGLRAYFQFLDPDPIGRPTEL